MYAANKQHSMDTDHCCLIFGGYLVIISDIIEISSAHEKLKVELIQRNNNS